MRSDARKRDDGLDEFEYTLTRRALRQIKAEAWDEGHRHRQRRGPDDCACFASSEGECACFRFGTGPLVSLADNPYRAS